MTGAPVAQRGPLLSESLQDVTEALTHVSSELGIFRAVLAPTITALGAVAGVVLLVSEDGERLTMADLEGYGEDAQTVWQQGPLSADLPAVAALRRGEPLFFEDADSLRAAYPALEGRAGHLNPVASAMLPLLLDGEALGVIVLDFREPHAFPESERRFLRILSGQCVLALGRLRVARRLEAQVRARTRQLQARTRELQERTEALDAFVAFSEAAGGESDAARLAEQATALLARQLPGARAAYLEGGALEPGDGWRVLAGDGAWLEGRLVEGRLADTALAREPLFGEPAGAAGDALYPLWPQREPGAGSAPEGAGRRGLLAVRLEDRRPEERQGEQHTGARPLWDERGRALVRAVGRSLALALERAALTETLQRQNTQLEARNRALEGFADLTRDLGAQTEPAALAQRAAEGLMALMPQGYALYFELDRSGPGSPLWRRRAQAGDLGSEALEQTVAAGLPYEQTRNLLEPWRTRQPLYQDSYDRDTDNLSEQTPHIRATACLPVLVRGEPVGVLACALFSGRAWSAGDRAVLASVAGSLGLAIEGAQNAVALQQRTEALQTANEELDAFAGSVSHDLRAPVRHVIAFAELAERALGEQQPARVERALGVVRQSGERMMTLIDAMLELSRAARQELRRVPVDLDALFSRARRELEPELAGRRVTFDLSPLPTVPGDPDTLHQVATNLLSNALKYSRTREHATVTVRAEEHPHEWRVTVRDDGVGFDPRYTERLFGMFQRLHGPEQFEGVGVGLANVRRIVTRHGGRVWAEGSPGEGATFGFSLPR